MVSAPAINWPTRMSRAGIGGVPGTLSNAPRQIPDSNMTIP